MFGQIQTSQTGGQLYSDYSPYGECCLDKISFWAEKWVVTVGLQSCLKQFKRAFSHLYCVI